MKRYLFYGMLLLLLPLRSLAQGEELMVVRGNCTPVVLDDADNSHRAARRLPEINTSWDATKTYKQLVILLSFSDTDFKEEHTTEYYDKLFNKEGFNERNGAGCVADYYRMQSGGLFNLQFDVYGPYKVSTIACPDPDNNYYGRDAMSEATNMLIAEHPEIDFSQYDWNGDGNVNQVVFIHAGISGNISGNKGYIWPNTGRFSSVTTPDGKRISSCTISAENFTNTISCGIGTICHEFTHSLGLPDIYPTNKTQGYSVCDEWDLMDGGNFTNYGWCPPNFTALEKYLLGWLEFTDLEGAASITDLKPSADGGEVYRIKHSDSEWLLLENRQQKDWDAGAPGKGLVIYHVNYDGYVWLGNSVNNDRTKRRFYLVPADNMDYDAWTEYRKENGLSNYAHSSRMNSRYLSTSPYPYITEEVVNNELTDTSTPAAVMHYPDGALLGKPITNIRMSKDGLVSFDFMGGNPSGIREIQTSDFRFHDYYGLQGRRVDNPQQGNLYIVRTSQGIRKQLYR